MACMQSWQLLFNSGQSQFLQHPLGHIMFWLVVILTIQLQPHMEPNQITLVFQRHDLHLNPSYLGNIVPEFNLKRQSNQIQACLLVTVQSVLQDILTQL